jgi:hypothetical protein
MSRSRSLRRNLHVILVEEPYRISQSCALMTLFLAGLIFAVRATYMGTGFAVVTGFLLLVSFVQYRKHGQHRTNY